jgi:hypothetical protein
MFISDSLRSADGRAEAITRRRLLHVAATVAAIAPLAALSASGAAQASPMTPEQVNSIFTSYNETMADNAFRWLDDNRNFTKRADLRKGFDDFLSKPDGHLDPKEMIERMIEIVPSDTGRFRNVMPRSTEDMLKPHEVPAWENSI